MRIFISSVISGFERERAAAVAAVRALRHTPIMAEDFEVSPTSPQAKCLAGVRGADAMILLLGERYGARQAFGFSATHEEFHEARERCPVLSFVQSEVTPEPAQAEFIREVQDWASGGFTGSFSTPESLQMALVGALHAWELSQARGGPNPQEMVERALAILPKEQRGYHTGTTRLALAIAGGPRQEVLRPSQIEDTSLARDLHQTALFGPSPVFAGESGVSRELEGHRLTLAQDRPTRSITLDQDGSLVFQLPLVEAAGSGFPAIIEEEVRETLTNALHFASQVLDQIDPRQRISHVSVAATLLEADYRAWRTRAQHAASPGSGTMGHGGDTSQPATLSPPERPRSVLRQQSELLGEDLTVLLRRGSRTHRA